MRSREASRLGIFATTVFLLRHLGQGARRHDVGRPAYRHLGL